MIRTTLTALGCAAFVTLVACGDDVGEKYPSTESFCSALAEEECKAVAQVTCSTTVENCKTKRTASCQANASRAAGTGRSYRAGSAEGCINKTRDLLASRNIDPAKDADTYEACERVFAGSKEKTQTCANDYECTGSLVCSQGVCFDKTAKNKGEPCGNPGDTCAAGSYCDLKAAARFCVARPEANGICSADVPCVETLRCAGGVCLPKYKINEVCTTTDDCATGTTCTTVNNAKVCAATALPKNRTCKDDYGGT